MNILYRKLIKILLFIIGSIFLILILSVWGVELFFKDKIIQYAVKQINNEVNAKIQYSGYHFVVWKTFPNVSVEFNDFIIRSLPGPNTQIDNDTLLKAESTYFEFGLFKVLTNHYQLKQIQINKGSLNLITYKTGDSNFEIIKKKPSNNSTSSEIQLNSIVLKECKIHYMHVASELDIQVFSKRTILSGEILPGNIDFRIKGQLLMHSLQIRNYKYLANKEIDLKTRISILNNSDYLFNKSEIIISDVPFEWSGKVVKSQDLLSFAIQGEALDFNKLITLFPPQVVSQASNYNTKGKCNISLSINGKLNSDQTPLVKLNYSLTNAQIEEKKSKIKLSNLDLQLIYSNGKDKKSQQSYIQINKFSSKFGPGSFSMNGLIENIYEPKVNISVASVLNLNNLKNFLRLDTLEILDGDIKGDIKIRGVLPQINEVKINDTKSLSYIGQLWIQSAGIKFRNSDYYVHNINGKVIIDNDLIFENLTLSLHENPINIKGRMTNGLPYLFGISKQTHIDAELDSKKLDLSKYFVKGQSQVTGTYSREILFPQNLSFKLKLNVNEFKLNKFNAKWIVGDVNYAQGRFEIQTASFETCEGRVKGSGTIDQDFNKDFIVKGEADVTKLNINQLFTTFNNFSQDVVKSEHLKGRISGKVHFSSAWSKRLEFYPEKLIVDADVTIYNGELVNFQPLYGLSKFISLEELSNIKFTTLHNTIYIKDKQIIIPQMDIQSSAFNITGSGTHTFDKHYNYKVRVLLSEFLFRKAKNAKKENEEFGQVEDDGLGRTTIPLKIEGIGSDYKVEYDPKSSWQLMKESLNKQKTELKQIFREEFGWFKKDSTTHNTGKDKKPINVNWDDNPNQQKSDTRKNKKDSDNKLQFEFE